MDMNFGSLVCGPYHVIIWMHGETNPSAEGWTETVQKVAATKQSLDGDISQMRCMAVTDGGGPNAGQRRELFVEVLEGRAKSCVITDNLNNPLKRGIATALSWLNPNFRAFLPHQFDAAIGHIDLSEYKSQIFHTLTMMKSEMPTPIKTYEALATHSRSS